MLCGVDFVYTAWWFLCVEFGIVYGRLGLCVWMYWFAVGCGCVGFVFLFCRFDADSACDWCCFALWALVVLVLLWCLLFNDDFVGWWI